jgi:hypothetical protein
LQQCDEGFYLLINQNNMRNSYILLALLIISEVSSAQKSEPSGTNEKRVEGYVILIRPALAATFLFDILKDGKIVYSQASNPFTMQAEGFEKKDEAFKIAEWLIGEYKLTQHFPPVIPPHVANQYKIKLTRETRPNQN